MRDYRVIAVLSGGFKTLCLPTPGTAQYMIHSIISFIFTCFRRVTLQQSWFSGGPPSKRKKHIHKIKYNTIINKEKEK